MEDLKQEMEVKEEQTRGVCTRSRKKEGFKKRFSAKRLAVMAIFVAIAYVLSLFDFPIFPAASFLKLDFGNVFILLIAFLLGPLEGVIVCILKETIRITASTSGGVGELANMLVTSSYILLPAIVYQYRKGIKTVIFALAGACLIGTAVALITNRFINFPLYEAFLGMPAKEAFELLWGFILAFNLIKTMAISALTMLLYKRLSNFLKKWKI